MSLINPVRDLTPQEAVRYGRHLSIPGVGAEGQQRLLASRVLVVGAGGLGSPVIMYLTAAGVGTLGIVDDDVVDASNLQRQVIHAAGSVGTPKVASAKAFAEGLNPSVVVEAHRERLDQDNALDLVTAYDLVVDGTDNFVTRYLVNDACVLAGKPSVWGSVYQFSAQASVFWAGRGPCYRCLYPEAPPPEYAPNCAEGGVFGALCGTVGSLQAGEAVKLITGAGSPLLGRLWVHDASRADTRVVTFPADPGCPACGPAATMSTVTRIAPTACSLQQRLPTTDVGELARRLAARERGEDAFELWDIREDHEWLTGVIPGARLVGSAGLAAASAAAAGKSEVILYCQGGVRSARALPQVLAAGCTALHLDGGMTAWQRTQPSADPVSRSR